MTFAETSSIGKPSGLEFFYRRGMWIERIFTGLLIVGCVSQSSLDVLTLLAVAIFSTLLMCSVCIGDETVEITNTGQLVIKASGIKLTAVSCSMIDGISYDRCTRSYQIVIESGEKIDLPIYSARRIKEMIIVIERSNSKRITLS
jgi:hypothetical protein